METIEVNIKIKAKKSKKIKNMKVIGYKIQGLDTFAVTEDISNYYFDTNNNDPWTITHIPTGMQIAVFYKSISAAQKAAKKYLDGMDWNLNEEEIKNNPQALKKLRGIYNGVERKRGMS